MNNQTSKNILTESPEKLQRQDDSLEQQHNGKRASISNSSILLNIAEPNPTRPPSPLQLYISQDSPVPLSPPTSSAAVTTATVTSYSLSSKCSSTSINGISMPDNLGDTASSITIQRSSSLSPEIPPLITKTAINPAASRSLVPSTTIKRKTSSGEALKEIKHLQLLMKSKDAEITKLSEQNKKLKHEVENISTYSVRT
jgi:hypothetical protein